MEPVKAPAPLVTSASSGRRCLLFRLAGAQRYPYLLPLGCHL